MIFTKRIENKQWPVIEIADIEKAVSFFTEQLCFQLAEKYENHCLLQLGDLSLFLKSKNSGCVKARKQNNEESIGGGQKKAQALRAVWRIYSKGRLSKSQTLRLSMC